MGHAWIVILLLAGCASQPTWAPNPLEIPAAGYSQCFEASVDVLREHGFRVDRADHRFGVVTTKPLGSPTVFEPWKRTHTSAGRTEQSTWSDLRRTVTVTLKPAQQGAAPQTYVVRANVEVQRQTLPLRRLDGSVIRKGVFASLSTVPDEWHSRGIAQQHWEPIGRDGALEERLLGAIIERSREMVDEPVP